MGLGGGRGRGKGCGHLGLSKGRGLGVLVPGHLTVQLTLGQLDVLTGAFAKGIQHARILLHQTAFRSMNTDMLFVFSLFLCRNENQAHFGVRLFMHSLNMSCPQV